MKTTTQIIEIGVDKNNKKVHIFDNYNIEHTELYLQIAKELTKMLTVQELKEFKIELKNRTFKNLDAFAEANQIDIAKSMGMSREELEKEVKQTIKKNKTHKDAKPKEKDKMSEIADCAGKLADIITNNCKPGRERDIALTKLEEVIMWVGASLLNDED